MTRGGDLPATAHSVRIRDGDRELEVSGAPAFVRQILDDLPALLGRLRGEATGRTAISMPAPPAAAAAAEPSTPTTTAGVSPAHGNGQAGAATDVEAQVFEVLKASSGPLPISAIRERMPSAVTGQQVRRILERAESRVTVSDDRPATYSLH